MSQGRPYKCVGTTARVRGVIARSNAAGSRLNVTRIDVREDRRRARRRA